VGQSPHRLALLARHLAELQSLAHEAPPHGDASS
jgi:hypothetical protein